MHGDCSLAPLSPTWTWCLLLIVKVMYVDIKLLRSAVKNRWNMPKYTLKIRPPTPRNAVHSTRNAVNRKDQSDMRSKSWHFIKIRTVLMFIQSSSIIGYNEFQIMILYLWHMMLQPELASGHVRMCDSTNWRYARYRIWDIWNLIGWLTSLRMRTSVDVQLYRHLDTSYLCVKFVMKCFYIIKILYINQIWSSVLTA